MRTGDAAGGDISTSSKHSGMNPSESPGSWPGDVLENLPCKEGGVTGESEGTATRLGLRWWGIGEGGMEDGEGGGREKEGNEEWKGGL